MFFPDQIAKFSIQHSHIFETHIANSYSNAFMSAVGCGPSIEQCCNEHGCAIDMVFDVNHVPCTYAADHRLYLREHVFVVYTCCALCVKCGVVLVKPDVFNRKTFAFACAPIHGHRKLQRENQRDGEVSHSIVCCVVV